MNKLELTSKVLLADMEKAENKEQALKEGLKSFAADVLNLVQFLRAKNVDEEAARDIVQQEGMDYNLKTKKFS